MPSIQNQIRRCESNVIFWDAKIKDLRTSGLTIDREVLRDFQMHRNLNSTKARKLARSVRFCS